MSEGKLPSAIVFWSLFCLATASLLPAPAKLHSSAGLFQAAQLAPLCSAGLSSAIPLGQWSPELRRLLLLEDYNTRVVVAGASLLGAAAGLVGSFMLLRRRALMGDALSHATWPGIVLAYVVLVVCGVEKEHQLPFLMLGGLLSGCAGVATVLFIRKFTRLKEDTALGVVLSVYFGLGVALWGIVQKMPEGHAAGLETFIYGKAASMNFTDVAWIVGVALTALLFSIAVFKELKLLCFDDGYAGSRGMPVLALDLALMAIVVAVCIVGLQAVGLILMIALLVIPAAAARFWARNLTSLLWISSLIGLASGWFGTLSSGLLPGLPSGAMIVLVCSLVFLFSMAFGASRGVVVRAVRRWKFNRAIHQQHLLRALFEILESSGQVQLPRLGSDLNLGSRDDTARNRKLGELTVPVEALLAERSWTRTSLLTQIHRAERHGFLVAFGNKVRLTWAGLQESFRLTRQHRLWELYLIAHADIAPSRVDRDADRIEHVLEPEIVAELETLLEQRQQTTVPESPHALSRANELDISGMTTTRRSEVEP